MGQNRKGRKRQKKKVNDRSYTPIHRRMHHQQKEYRDLQKIILIIIQAVKKQWIKRNWKELEELRKKYDIQTDNKKLVK